MVATLEYKRAEPVEAQTYASPLCCTYSDTLVTVKVHTPEPSEAHKNQYVFCACNPVNCRDPDGRWTVAAGVDANGSVGPSHVQQNLQATFSANGLNPLDWRIGITYSVGGGVGVGMMGASGLLLSWSEARMPEEFGVRELSQSWGGSIGKKLIFGYEMGNLPSYSEPCENARPTKHDVFIGVEVETDWPVNAEFHHDMYVWTASKSWSLRELGQRLKDYLRDRLKNNRLRF